MLFLHNDLFVFLVPFGDFYPYGVIEGDTAVPTNDDGSSGAIPISVSFPYFNQNHHSVFVSKHGLILYLQL